MSDNFYLGNMELDPTDKYKYLGTIINNKLSMSDQKENRRNIPNSTSNSQRPKLPGNRNARKPLETYVIPLITYVCET